MTLPTNLRINITGVGSSSNIPANIRVNIGAPFPARVSGASYITVVKYNGLWTIVPNYSLLGAPIGNLDPTVKEVVIYDVGTGVFNVITLATLVATFTNSYRMVTAAGDVTVLASDSVILLNKGTGAATNIDLPTSASRNGLPITVKDYKGDANTNNITFVPASGETIDGYDASDAAANGLALIDIALGKKTLNPLASGGWYI